MGGQVISASRTTAQSFATKQQSRSYQEFNLPPRKLQINRMKFSALAIATLVGAVSALPGPRPMITAAPEMKDLSASVSAKHTSKHSATHPRRAELSLHQILIVVHLPQLLQRLLRPLRLRHDDILKGFDSSNGAHNDWGF
ncbi:hypothetical protein FHL15_008656 [Xylaria flabelliformis]|uniref:Uncharacterized protein n=1 Tax=Xylaria flabelliformis TaxID=2512241 RepID=A0A553HR98_9PEZI|nr:hypothetical protein FHL15_008656 [Xylaria flabelliformis]